MSKWVFVGHERTVPTSCELKSTREYTLFLVSTQSPRSTVSFFSAISFSSFSFLTSWQTLIVQTSCHYVQLCITEGTDCAESAESAETSRSFACFPARHSIRLGENKVRRVEGSFDPGFFIRDARRRPLPLAFNHTLDNRPSPPLPSSLLYNYNNNDNNTIKTTYSPSPSPSPSPSSCW